MAKARRATAVATQASMLDALLSFRSVAVVGASDDSYWAAQLVRNLGLARGAPRVFTVHPQGRRLGTLPCVPSLAASPFRPDLAVLVAPASAAPALVAEAAAAGARAAIVVGDPPTDRAGAELLPALVEAARAHSIVVLGPSSLGALSPARAAFPFAGRLLDRPRAGDVALVTQSGGIAIELLRAPLLDRFGLSHLVNVGVGTACGAAAVLEALAEDDDTKVVGAYVERLEDPPRWARALCALHRAGKPLVVLRGGREGPAERAAVEAAAATRVESLLAVGGNDPRTAGFLRHHGAAEAPTLEALVEALVLLDHHPPPRGRRVGIAALSASAGRLAADAFRAAGLEVSLPGAAGGARARASASAENPLDLTGKAVEQPREGAKRLRAFAGDPRFDVVVLACQPPRGTTPSDARLASWVATLAEAAGRERVAVPVQPFHGPLPVPAIDGGNKGNPFLTGLAEAAAAVAAACAVGEARRRAAEPLPVFADVDAAVAGAPLLGPERTLSEPASLELLGRYGIPVARWRLCTTATAASRFAHELGVRVAVKAATPDVPAKAAAGLVRLDLDGDAAVRTAFHDVTIRAQGLVRPDRMLGATVMAMFDGAARLVVGLVRDERLGMLVTARRADLSGAEPNVAVRACPLRRSQAAAMAAELGLNASAAGAADVPALVEALVRLARLGADLGALVAAACIGPLIVAEGGKGCAAVDASVVLRPL
jgi:acyl-CoA synthetase (NDP forming)